MAKLTWLLSICMIFSGMICQANEEQKMKEHKNPTVEMKTSEGNIKIELYADKAPESVKNFLDYANSGFYNGTIFHRVIDGFMIQGGGFVSSMEQKPTKSPIVNEAGNGLKNSRGTLAMARTSDINSATAQFFINLKDNDFLDYKSQSPREYGYAVFGKVIDGMDVVDKIKAVKTGSNGVHRDVPVVPVEIISVTVQK